MPPFIVDYPKIDLSYPNLEKLMASYRNNSNYHESDSDLKKIAYRTLEVLDGRNISDAIDFIKTYESQSNYRECAKDLSEVTCKTLKALGKRDASDAINLIKTYESQSDYRECAKDLSEVTCKTLKALGKRDASDAINLIKTYESQSDYREQASNLSEAVCQTLEALDDRHVSDAIDFIKTCKKTTPRQSSHYLSKATCEALCYDRYAWREKLYSLRTNPLHLYKENTKDFMDCFSNVDDGDKKNILRIIMTCEYENKEIIAWLDNNYAELVKEVGLEA